MNMAGLPIGVPEGGLAVRTTGLVKRYRGGILALDGVELGVPEGAAYLLVGANGAGKSTLFHVLMNLTRPTRGSAAIFGVDAQRDGPLARAQVGYVPEHHEGEPKGIPATELLRYAAAFHGAWDAAYATELLRLLEIDVMRPAERMSKGEWRRVQLVRALAHRPPLLLLDEPTDGLDPLMRDRVMEVLATQLAETPTTILVATHHAAEIERLADHVGVLREGRLVAQLPLEQLRRGLIRYRAEVPEGWRGVPELNGAVVRRAGGGREILWTVWGPEAEVLARLAASGATVREASPLRLEDAVLTLLHRGD